MLEPCNLDYCRNGGPGGPFETEYPCERDLFGRDRSWLVFGGRRPYAWNMEIPEFLYVRVCGLAVLVCLAGGCAARSETAALTPEPRPAAEPVVKAVTAVEDRVGEELPDGVFHRVLPGQTLWRIAKTYDVPLEHVVRVNGIEDATRISVGDMVWIPGVARELDVEIASPPPAVAAGEWIWPVPNGTVLSTYGAPRRTHRHGGIDIGAPHGRPVLATRAGRVVYSGAGLRGYGKTIILDHGEGMQSLYAHNSALLVSLGEGVDQGQSIARIGRTGNATADHCHFEIRVNERRVDPMRWVDHDRRASR